MTTYHKIVKSLHLMMSLTLQPIRLFNKVPPSMFHPLSGQWIWNLFESDKNSKFLPSLRKNSSKYNRVLTNTIFIYVDLRISNYFKNANPCFLLNLMWCTLFCIVFSILVLRRLFRRKLIFTLFFLLFLIFLSMKINSKIINYGAMQVRFMSSFAA